MRVSRIEENAISMRGLARRRGLSKKGTMASRKWRFRACEVCGERLNQVVVSPSDTRTRYTQLVRLRKPRDDRVIRL